MNGPCIQNQPASRSHTLARQAGVTVLELMIGLLLVSIVTAFAVPGYRTMVQNNKIDTTSSAMVLMINLARSEAVKSNNSVFLCAGKTTGTGLVCETGDDSKQWAAGGLVFLYRDSDNNGTVTNLNSSCTGDDTDCKIDFLDGEDLGDGVTIYTADNGFLRIRSDGSPTSQRVFNICDNRGTSSGKRVTVTATGRLKVINGASACS